MRLGQLFGTRLALWTMAIVGTPVFPLNDVASSKTYQVATIVRGPSKTFLLGWTSSISVFSSMDGNAQRQFGRYPNLLDKARKTLFLSTSID